MKFLAILLLASTSALAKDSLTDFNQKLMENFNKDIRNGNDLAVKKEKGPARGPASVVPENYPRTMTEEKKLEKNIRQTGHPDW